MRICYLGDGRSVHNHFMAEWFVRRGHSVLFATDTPEEAPPCETAAVAPRRGGLFRHLAASMRVRRLVRAWRPDIVHAHNVTGYGYWGALCGFSPLAVTAWGTDLNILAQERRLVRSLVKYALRRADWITADAAALCETARALAGRGADVRLLQWGVDLNEFAGAVPPDLESKIRGGAEFVFLSTRRLRPLYNIDIILRAFAEVRRALPSARLVIAGDDRQRAELESLARGLGVAQAVCFLGWAERKILTAAMRCADAFISIPSSDSTALSLLEAFAARIPVITGDLEANREWIVHGENGLLVPPRDTAALRDAMLWIAARAGETAAWTEANYRRVERDGNREREMTKLEGWYRASAEAGKPGV